MIRYMGYAINNTQVHIGLLGDGTSKTVNVDLTAAPFLLQYPKSNYPSGCKVQMEDGTEPAATLASGVVTFTFPKAPPAPQPNMLSPRTQLILHLTFG